MKKWEYFRAVTTGSPPEEGFLNKMGDNGWELVSMVCSNGNQIFTVFKREVR